MKTEDFDTIRIEERLICIKGIGKLFFQEGFPVSMSISLLKTQGIEVSIFHVADECMKNGWSAKTTYNKLLADFEEDIADSKFNLEELHKFCYAEYEEQREMIFQYLFGKSSKSIIESGKEKIIEWFDSIFIAEENLIKR